MSNQQYYEALASSTIVNKQGLNSMHTHTHTPSTAYVTFICMTCLHFTVQSHVCLFQGSRNKLNCPEIKQTTHLVGRKIPAHLRKMSKQVDVEWSQMKWPHVGRMLRIGSVSVWSPCMHEYSYTLKSGSRQSLVYAGTHTWSKHCDTANDSCAHLSIQCILFW